MLRITTLQLDLVWEDKAQNLAKIDTLLRGDIGETDVIVLPEMFTTGFSMSAAALAETIDGATVQQLFIWAARHNAAITGSFICRVGAAYYNRLVWVTPDGQCAYYDKKHLFTYGEEPQHYTAGRERRVITWRGWRICPLVCYDLRFPAWSRNRLVSGQPEYDLLLYVANWPESRRLAWQTLLAARAIENQAYCVGVNRVGMDGKGLTYSGDTTVVDYQGAVLHTAAYAENLQTNLLSSDLLLEYRQKFRFLADQDAFEWV